MREFAHAERSHSRILALPATRGGGGEEETPAVRVQEVAGANKGEAGEVCYATDARKLSSPPYVALG